MGILGAAVTGPASPAVAAGEVEHQSLSINPERLGVEQLGLTIGAEPYWSWTSDDDVQLRIPSSLVRAVPDAVDHSWLGAAGELRWETTSPSDYVWADHQALFTLSTAQVDLTSEEDPLVYFSLSNPVAPGAFSIFTPPGDPSAEIRWGTGTQRDGSPQDLHGKVGLPPEVAMFPTKASFSASGLYCFDVTTTATVTDWDWDNYDEETDHLPLLPGMDPVSVTKTVRIAVGDEVAADAECGTATHETPTLQDPVPDVPTHPTASVNGTSVTIGWLPPASSGGSPVTEYTVTLSNNVSTPLVRSVAGDTTSVRFDDVPAGRYQARVVASNEFGDSRASEGSPWVIVEAAEGAAVVIASGHIDGIAPQIDTDASGALSLALRAHHDDYGWLGWDDFVLYTNDSAQRTLPAEYRSGEDWSFLDEAGSRIWESPQTRRDSLPWVGLSTEHSSIYEHIPHDETLGIRIEGVTGDDGGPAPGAFAMSQGGNGYGPAVNGAGLRASTVEGLPSGLRIGPGVHQHFSWYFTEPGVYCVAVAVDAVLPDGERHTARGLLTHVVGETVDPTTVTPCAATVAYPEVTAPPSVPVADPEEPFVFDGGFGSLSLALSGGAWDARLLHSTSYRNAPPQGHDVEDVVFLGRLRIDAGGVSDGRYYFGTQEDPWVERDSLPHLGWDTFGVPQDQVEGDVSWRVSDVRGPGDLGVEDRSWTATTVLDSARGIEEADIWSQSGTRQGVWWVTQPGRYCVDLTWSARTVDHGEVSATRTITVVADGEGFEADAEAFAVTCADGAEPTVPGGGPGPGPGPETPAWEVPNWSRTASGARILNLGHVDVASTLEDGVLDTLIKDTTTEGAQNGAADGWASWHEPEDVVFQLLPGARREVPPGEAFGVLGETGSSFWLAPETQNPTVLWPGWSTERIPSGTLDGGVEWRLTGKRGPGDFLLFTSDPAAVDRVLVQFDTSDGIDDEDVVPIGPREHVHGNWAFTAEGAYCLTFERSATLASGGPVSDRFTLAVAVGETDPTVVDPAACEVAGPVAPGPVDPGPAAPGAVVPDGVGSAGPGADPAGQDSPGAGSRADRSGDRLPVTGAPGVLRLTAGAGVLLLAGGTVVAVARRRGRAAA